MDGTRRWLTCGDDGVWRARDAVINDLRIKWHRAHMARNKAEMIRIEKRLKYFGASPK